MSNEEKLRALLAEAQRLLQIVDETDSFAPHAYFRGGDHSSTVEFARHVHGRIDAALAEPMNQCDGCNVGAPIENGIHDYANGSRIGCTRDKYTFSSKEN